MATPPTLPTTWSDSSPRPTNLKNAVNDIADAVNKLAAVGYAGWTSYTPTLTAATTNPTLGAASAGAVQFGRYCKVGRLVVAQFGIRFATSGASAGSGAYTVSLPVTAKTAGFSAGLTSDIVGHGSLWRGNNAFDLVAGAHLHVNWHVSDGATGSKILGLYQPGAQGIDLAQASKTADQTGIGTSATDVTSLSLSHTPTRTGSRVKVTAELHVGHETSATGDIYAQITDGSGTNLRRVAVHAAKIATPGVGTGLIPVRISYVDESPTVGVSKTYKVQCFAGTGTMAVAAASAYPSTIRTEELPGVSTSGLSEQTDYVSDAAPWKWSDGNGGPEMWGVLVYESAS